MAARSCVSAMGSVGALGIRRSEIPFLPAGLMAGGSDAGRHLAMEGGFWSVCMDGIDGVGNVDVRIGAAVAE